MKHDYVVTVRRADQPYGEMNTISIDPDDIYQAGVDAELRGLARIADWRQGLRHSPALGEVTNDA